MKGGIDTLYQQFYQKLFSIEEELSSLSKQVASLPEGTLICTKNSSYIKPYQKLDDSLIYLNKGQRHLAEQLALKKYLSLQIEDLQQEKHIIESLLKQHERLRPKAPRLISKPSYRKLLAPHLTPKSNQHHEWMTAPYERNPTYPDQLLYHCISNNVVRSKSESLIDLALNQYHIPYRYECALYLDGLTLYPDFTILHPITNEIIYWEHFGMMDIPSYAHKTYKKLDLYTEYGIIPSINLIVTFETKDNPLDPRKIERIIKEYFL